MARDPNELFVTNTITRAHVAQDLNDYLDAHREDDTSIVVFTPDDDRLTTSVCAAYAEFVGNLDPYDQVGSDEDQAKYLHTLATNLGADMSGFIDNGPPIYFS